MSKLLQRVAVTVFFAGAISLAGNPASLTPSCQPMELEHGAAPLRDAEPAAVVRALQSVFAATPTARACDFWQDHAGDFQGVSTANRARIQRFGDALHFTSYADASQRKAAVEAALESIRVANPELPACEWATLLGSVEKSFRHANP